MPFMRPPFDRNSSALHLAQNIFCILFFSESESEFGGFGGFGGDINGHFGIWLALDALHRYPRQKEKI